MQPPRRQRERHPVRIARTSNFGLSSYAMRCPRAQQNPWSHNMRSSVVVTPDFACHSASQGGPRILDLGCGDGTRAIALASSGCLRVIGLDASKIMIDVAIQRAARRRVNVTFVCGDPCTTPFDSCSFDEVMILGGLFGHTGTVRSDADLLREAKRVVKPCGLLHLSFDDGDWIRSNLRPESVEGFATGFIYRHRSLADAGRSLRTEVTSADERCGMCWRETIVERLYTPREVTELLHRVGFGSITYEDSPKGDAPSHSDAIPPRHVIHARAGRSGTTLHLVQ